MSSGPIVSVIVPVYNDAKGLQRCLQSLARQTLESDSFEVLVVDNGSDESPASVMPPHPEFRLLEEPQPGSYAARNRGLAAARGDIVAFTDADCIPRPDWLEQGVKFLQRHPNVGVLAGKIEVFPENEHAPTLVERYQQVAAFPQSRSVAERRFGATANVFTRRFVIESVGPFLTTLRSGGDMEWCQRAHNHGFTIAYSDDVVVRHPARNSLRALIAQAARVAGGRHDIRNRATDPTLRASARPLNSALQSLRILWSDTRLPDLRTKVGVVGIGLAVRAAYLLENLRLVLGGTPRR